MKNRQNVLRRFVGWLMIAMLFGGLYLLCAKFIGWKPASYIFGGVGALIGWMMLAVSLIVQ